MCIRDRISMCHTVLQFTVQHQNSSPKRVHAHARSSNRSSSMKVNMCIDKGEGSCDYFTFTFEHALNTKVTSLVVVVCCLPHRSCISIQASACLLYTSPSPRDS
eukprot:TRINITY_DN45876_c0_g1_i2.p1 TRINITY_DN45876_c0_g1~~TRINITY_DN45876_c0_g1_i2.p1  ORF type:complete len:104 (+),score=9.93 TRINITY_DN45876_c0_g1_i2:169-480(+)